MNQLGGEPVCSVKDFFVAGEYRAFHKSPKRVLAAPDIPVPVAAPPHEFYGLVGIGSKEIGVSQSDSIYASNDGAKLDYFEAGSEDSARLKRVAEYAETSNGYWWSRSAARKNSGFVFVISNIGVPSHTTAENEAWVRPALILPSTALIDDTGLLIG